MATTPNYSWPTPDNTAYVKDGALAMRNLGNAIDSTTKSVSDVANAAIPKTLVNAKGDLIVATADDTVTRLGVGTNGFVLTADSTQASGVKWAAASSGADTWTLISSVTASSTAVNFNSITGYRRLRLVGVNITGTSNTYTLRLNNTSTALYGYSYLSGATGSAVNQTAAYNATSFGMLTAASSNATFDFFFDLANQSVPQTMTGWAVSVGGNSANTTYNGVWGSASAITSVNFLSSATMTGGTLYLYGVAA